MSVAEHPGAVETPDHTAPVTMLELFFDLVFVLTVTQLTSTIGTADGVLGYVQAGALLFVIWWMYDGYCWLANNVGPTTLSTQLPMLFAMAAFLVLAIAIPGAYGDDALLFALAYLAVVVVHGLSFMRSTLGGSAQAMLRIAPVNLGICVMLFVAAALPQDYRWVAWVAAVLVPVGSMLARREAGFSIRPGHFAERHRLLLIIALGESVIAIGLSAEGRISQGRYLVAVLLAMVLLALFWWVHFSDEDRTTEALVRLERDDPDRLARVALMAFSMSYLVLVAGLVMVAAGLHSGMHAPTAPLSWRFATTMAVGVGVYLFGNALHLWLLDLSSAWPLKVAALLALPTAFLGHWVSSLAETAGACLLIGGALLASHD